jgi:hypothetical protein
MKAKEILITEAETIPLVDECPLSAHERETGYKAIVDKTTMNTICVVPIEHGIIQHKHVIDEVAKLDNYIIKKTMLSNNGRSLMLELTEREPKQIELLPQDFIECGARVFNDYGRSRGLSVQGCGTRVVCSNGAISPVKTKAMAVYAYGTAEFNKELEKQIEICIKQWESTEVTDLMKKANETVVSVKDVATKLPWLPKKYMDTIMDELNDEDTVYNIWNQYTRVITHEIGPKIQTAGLLGLQKRANKILALVKVVP